MYSSYDYTHPYETHKTNEGLEFGHPLTPDNGCNYNHDKMREDGYQFFQDFQHPDRDYPTRWWFRNMKVWNRYLPGVEAKGFVATSKLQNS